MIEDRLSALQRLELARVEAATRTMDAPIADDPEGWSRALPYAIAFLEHCRAHDPLSCPADELLSSTDKVSAKAEDTEALMQLMRALQ